MPRQASVYTGAYKLDPEPVKKTTTGGPAWLGPLEHAILAAVHRLGLKRFFLRDVYRELRVSPPRAHDALRRLIARGLARKLGRGYYELAADSNATLDADVRNIPSTVNGYGRKKASQENAEDTGGPRRAPGVPDALSAPASRGGGGSSTRSGSSGSFSSGVEFYYDNVMWYDSYGNFKRTGRSTLLDFLPERVVYSELCAIVRGLQVFGVIVVYSNREDPQPSVRVEWRPPSGFVRENDFVSVRRMFWLQLVLAFRAISAVLSRAPAWVRRSLARSPILWHNAAGSLYY